MTFNFWYSFWLALSHMVIHYQILVLMICQLTTSLFSPLILAENWKQYTGSHLTHKGPGSSCVFLKFICWSPKPHTPRCDLNLEIRLLADIISQDEVITVNHLWLVSLWKWGIWTQAGMHRGKRLCRHREKMAVSEPKREASKGASPAHTVVLDFGLQNWEAVHFCKLSHLFVVLCYDNTSRLIMPSP